MAGMLPGVEAARRRRFHQSGGCNQVPAMAADHSFTRLPSVRFFTRNQETHPSSCSTLQTRRTLYQAHLDNSLVGAAREAKERLDEKLRVQRKTQTRRMEDGKGNLSCVENTSAVMGELHTEVYGSKKVGFRRFSWAKVNRKATVHDECPICLEAFKVGETLMYLPCTHRFHSWCLEPWLLNNAHCPCCRARIMIS